jgi:fructose-1,6-bisphosphatase I
MGDKALLNAVGIGETHGDLGEVLTRFAGSGAGRSAVAEATRRFAEAAIHLEAVIASGWITKDVVSGADPADQRSSSSLDAIADELFIDALSEAPVAVIGSAMRDRLVVLDEAAPLAIAVHPLDGWRQIDTNVSIGALIAFLPFDGDPETALLQPGHRQLAAGFVIYGPQTCLALTLGEGTDIYLLDRAERRFHRVETRIEIPRDSTDYAIDAANHRHWDAAIQAYVDDKVAGADGPRERNFNMRWIGSLVAEAYRILIRGGIYLSPGDRREGFERGCLSLVHEANPLAMIIEQAGGLATDGEDRILDIRPTERNQCAPLVFGSSAKVERVKAFHDGTLPLGERSPLFGRRGLFRH